MDPNDTPEMTEALAEPAAPAEDAVSIEDFIGAQLDAAETKDAEDEEFEQASVDQEDTPEPAEENTEAKAEEGDTDAESDEPADEQTVTAPQSMSAKDREAFYALPPEQQKWLSERAQQQEAAFTKKTMELADQRKAFDKLEQVIAPRRQQLAMDGMDESTAVGQLFALSDFANQDPVGFVRYLFQQRGIPMSALTQDGAQTSQPDPMLTATQRELQGIKQMLQQQQTQAQEQTMQSVSAAIDEFAANPEYSFYSELESDMVPIVQALRQSNPGLEHKDYLAKAYKMAMAANEEVSAKVAADKKAKDEAARMAKAKKDAAEAKKAKSANVKSSGALPAAAGKAKSVDEFIGAVYDERVSV